MWLCNNTEVSWWENKAPSKYVLFVDSGPNIFVAHIRVLPDVPNTNFPDYLAKIVCWSLTSLCHSNGHIETMPAREINPFTALTRIRSQFLRTQWSTSNHSEWTRLRFRPLSHRGWHYLAKTNFPDYSSLRRLRKAFLRRRKRIQLDNIIWHVYIYMFYPHTNSWY